MSRSGISMQTAMAIKRLDAGEEGTPLRREPAPAQYASQGVSAPGIMTAAQRAKLQSLIDRRPDAAAFKRLK